MSKEEVRIHNGNTRVGITITSKLMEGAEYCIVEPFEYGLSIINALNNSEKRIRKVHMQGKKLYMCFTDRNYDFKDGVYLIDKEESEQDEIVIYWEDKIKEL
tara:strand:+ start:262 stop:567 length:306 start_codon:yes stop_codon:yes gene_type:complete